MLDTPCRLLVVDQGEFHSKEYIPRHLIELGHRITLVQWNSAVWGRELFERVIVSRLTNWPYLAKTLYAEHAREPFHGVVCYNEGALLAADDIARLLKLPRVSRYNAESFRHKDRMRVAWEAADIPVPRYRILHGIADARVLSTWQFPVVLKPAAMMGSKGVIRVEDMEEILRVLPTVLATDLEIPLGGELWTLSEAFNLPAVALAEEYVSGTEYSAEGVVVGGTYCLLGVTRKILAEEPYFDELGHVFPAAGLPDWAVADLEELLPRAHAALGLQNAVTHAEFRINKHGVVMMELNARIAGDHIPLLVDNVLGTDTVELMARCACGTLSPEEMAGRPHGRGEERHAAAIAFLAAPHESYGQRLVKLRVPNLPDSCETLYSNNYLDSGEIIPVPTGSGTTRLGHVIFFAPDSDTALNVVRWLQREIEVQYVSP